MMNDMIPWHWFKKGNVSKEDNKVIRPTFDKTIEKVFEDFVSDFGNFDTFLTHLIKGSANSNIKVMPRVDISEKNNEMIVEVDLPGVKEDDLDISISKDNMLTIKGKREDKQEEKDRNYYRLERSYGSFERSIALPPEYDQDKTEANFRDGILTLKITKKETEDTEIRKISPNS